MKSNNAAPPITGEEELEGLKNPGVPDLGKYPIDDFLIRNESRTIYEVIRRIESNRYIMNPDFQRDFIWSKEKQSKLIESVIIRIPLPVFYMAEDEQGRLVVVDGLQRLSTFRSFVNDDLKLRLPGQQELHGKKFSDLTPRLKNRVEDCTLILYITDSKTPERARLDIFERVNGSVPLTRQQMRNCLYMGEATKFLTKESQTDLFLEATGNSLKTQSMRDREFVNRFCAFQLLGHEQYQDNMDDFLALALQKMNKMNQDELSTLATQFHHGLANNLELHGDHAFRKHEPDQKKRSVLNASLWDVMSTGLSRYPREMIEESAEDLRQKIWNLLKNEEFNTAITIGTSDARKVRMRFKMAHATIKETLDAHQT